jgi:hypothetical protein
MISRPGDDWLAPSQRRSALPRVLAPEVRCVVCDAVVARTYPLSNQPDIPYPTCMAVACRMVVSRHGEMGEAGFRHYLQMQARHTQHRAMVARDAALRKAAELEENAAAFSTLRASLPAVMEPPPLQLLLPTGPVHACRMTKQRRERYRAHLREIIAEAIHLAPMAAVATAGPASAPSNLAGNLCAMCGGGCCSRGGEKAYLSGQTMRRVMEAQPGVSGDDILEAYMARVPVHARTGSCINHTAHGCSLPKEMRSDVCNRFSCESLARLQAAQRGPEAVQAVLIVRRMQDHWRRNEVGVDNQINALVVLRASGARRFFRSKPAPLD